MIDSFFFYPRSNNPCYCKQWKSSELILNINQHQLQGWFVEIADPESPIVIYYGGNAEDITITLSYLEETKFASLLIMNYRGFGKSTGRPTQKVVLSDALLIYDYLIQNYKVNPSKIFLVGRSIGASVAAYVSSQRPVGGLILLTPFDSIIGFLPKFLNFFPIRNCLAPYFNTSKYLEHFNGKMLIIAAGKDEVVPRSSLENLLTKFHEKITYVEIKEADHQNVSEFPEYWATIEKYIHSNS
ncbi:MAG: alpha/beta hydrolase [Chlamydiales bacterium]